MVRIELLLIGHCWIHLNPHWFAVLTEPPCPTRLSYMGSFMRQHLW